MVVRTLDGPEALERCDFEAPKPGAGEYLIRVEAVGINFFDDLITRGMYQRKPELPFAPGAELSGTIEAAGEGTKLAAGTRVMALVDSGAYASHIVVSAKRVFAIPDSMPFDEAAGFGIVYQTSYFGLVHRAAIAAGETALVHAAAGGVGLAAVQIAKALGAKVIATAGSEEKLLVAKENGADLGIAYRDATWPQQVLAATDGRGADVIYDPVGGDIFDVSTKCIAFNGRLVVVGFASGRIPSIAMNRVLLKNIAVTGLHWGAYFDLQPELVHDAHKALCKLYEDGKIRPVVSQTRPLEEAAAAIKELTSRRSTGKVVLTP